MIFAGVGFIVLMIIGTTLLAMSKGELRSSKIFVRLCVGVFRPMEYIHPMKQIKLSGREMAVLRSIDYASGSTGTEIQERTQMEMTDIADVLNGLFDVGYVETFPIVAQITGANVEATRFEINPSYALQLKEAMKR